MDEWNEHPPADWLVAGYLGYKSESKRWDEAVNNTRQMLGVLSQSGSKVMRRGP